MNEFLIEFFAASVLMGIGIGLDAAIVTSLQAHAMPSRKHAFNWIIGISLTHTLFPIVGYFLSYIGLQKMPMLAPVIGIIAFLLIAYFIVGELRIYMMQNSESNDSHQKSALVSIGLIIAVSWDALWSGPAKSAQVIHWPDFAIWSSFFLVGFTVMLLTSVSFLLTRFLDKLSYRFEHMQYHELARWLQYSVISYFGWLALTRYTLDIFIQVPYLLLFSFVLMGGLMLLIRQFYLRINIS